MKSFKLLVLALTLTFAFQIDAQTADEILQTYFENIGGIENWNKVDGVKMTASVSGQGMEFPVEIVQLKNGKQYTKITFQGKDIMQNVFDGETLWSHNFMSQKAEKSDAETTANMKLNMNDFPDAFLNYKEKGYTVEFVGNEAVDGTDTFKIKLTKEPVTIDGKEEEDVSYYYFDTENYVPIMIHSEIRQGQGKGMISEVKMSDYDEVDGLYFAFSMTQGVKDNPGGQPISISKIELNPEVDDSMFAFPEETETKETDDKDKN